MRSILRTMKYSFIRYPFQEIFGAPSHIAILRVLTQLSQGISGRELARRSKINDRTCRLALKRLEYLNLIENLGSGKTKLFRLNRENYFTKYVLDTLFSKEQEYLESVVAVLKNHLQNECLWSCIYGSIAKEADTALSDLDVLIVVNSEARAEKLPNKISELITVLFIEFGLSLSPLILTVNQWRNDPQFQALKSEVQQHHIQITGKPG